MNSFRYKIWLWVGKRIGVLKQHDVKVGTSMLRARSALENAIVGTPLEKHLEEYYGQKDKN